MEKVQENTETEVKENEESEIEGEFIEDSAKVVETVEEPEETVEKQEEKIFDQESANKAFIKNKQKLNEERAEKQRLAKEKADLEAELAKFKNTGRPNIPEIPDPYDDDYEDKVKIRDEAIASAAAYDLNKANIEKEHQTQAELAAKNAQEADQKLLNDYAENVKNAGIDDAEMIKRETVVASYIQDRELSRHIMSLEDAPHIVSFLAANPTEAEKLSNMNPINAGVYIATNVLPNAQKLKPETTKTPEPLDIPSGKGAKTPDPNDKYMSGGEFI